MPSQSSHQRISNEHIQSSAASFFVKDLEGQRCLKINPYSRRQGISYSYEFRGKAIKYEVDPTLYYNEKRNTFLKDFLFRSFYESNGDQRAFEEMLMAENIPFREVCGYDAMEEEPKLKKMDRGSSWKHLGAL